MTTTQIIAAIDAEIAKLHQAQALLSGESFQGKPGRPTKAVAASGNKSGTKKRTLTPEGRKRIIDAVKRRWAAQKRLKD